MCLGEFTQFVKLEVWLFFGEKFLDIRLLNALIVMLENRASKSKVTESFEVVVADVSIIISI